MTINKNVVRPPKALIEGLRDIGAATVAGTLGHMGFKNPHMVGPLAQNHGKSIVGPALTLQFMPQRPTSSPKANTPIPRRSCTATSCIRRRRAT